MKKRFLLSLLVALLLPFPGPHLDSYIALGWLPLRQDFWNADWFFHSLFGALLIFYGLVSFVVITAITRLKKRLTSNKAVKRNGPADGPAT